MQTPRNDPVEEWREFVTFTAGEYALGRTEREIGAKVEGRRVRWRGKVRKLYFKGRKLNWIAVDMPTIEIPLKRGWTFVGDYAAIWVIDAKSRERCAFLREGHEITFTATLRSSHEIFAGVNFAEVEDQKKVHLMFGLADAEVE
jgi:hypothetical protein